nr:N-acetylmuramoyl-L-alanine amidase [Prauserella marina]
MCAVRCRAGVVVAAVVLAGCSSTAPTGSPGSTPVVVEASAGPGTPPTTSVAIKPVIVVDAGHNGGNASDPDAVNRQVPAGRGATKPCNTTGTVTESGYPEHAFTFDVARRVSDALDAKGLRVVNTRADDTGVGPCVDERAAIGNEAEADAVVSIHADGNIAEGARGFHIAYSDPPLNPAQEGPALELADAMLAAMSSSGFAPAGYIGEGGLDGRADLAGLNLSERPAILVECGNMRDAADAAVMTSPEGRQRYADAIVAGIFGYLD